MKALNNVTVLYILLDITRMELTTVSKLPTRRKGIAIFGKYQEGTAKNMSMFSEHYLQLIEEGYTYRTKLAGYRG